MPAAAHDIEIQAIRAGTLHEVSMGDDTSHSTGTNDPVIVHGRLDPAVALPSSGAANLPLAAGRWAITAKAYVTNAGAVQPVVDCTLEGPAEIDRTSVHPDQEASPGESVPVALAGMVDLASAGSVVFDPEESGGTLDVRCSSNSATGGIQARSVRIVAVKAGTLTTGS